MNRERLQATLNRDEDCKLHRHQVEGKDHIGWGINLEEVLPDELLEYLGVEDEDEIEEITQEQADYLRDFYINIAEKDAISVFGDELWKDLTDLRREVLTNLSYNLGINRFKKFRKMIGGVKNGDWACAAAQMLDSEAARSKSGTGKRYHRLAPAFEHNDEIYLELSEQFDPSGKRRARFDWKGIGRLFGCRTHCGIIETAQKGVVFMEKETQRKRV